MNYQNYTALLKKLQVETTHIPLSWFLNSKVPGAEGTLWAADPAAPEGSLRRRFEKDFARYAMVEAFARRCTDFFTLRWAPWKRHDQPSMYANHTGLGLLNPLNVVPLHTLFKVVLWVQHAGMIRLTCVPSRSSRPWAGRSCGGTWSSHRTTRPGRLVGW
jgi:hypothetical protein